VAAGRGENGGGGEGGIVLTWVGDHLLKRIIIILPSQKSTIKKHSEGKSKPTLSSSGRHHKSPHLTKKRRGEVNSSSPEEIPGSHEGGGEHIPLSWSWGRVWKLEEGSFDSSFSRGLRGSSMCYYFAGNEGGGEIWGKNTIRLKGGSE